MLLFYAGSECYAMDASAIVEIIPKIAVSPIPHVPAYVAGLINYGGTPVPVIDLNHFVNQCSSSAALHTRIILVQASNAQVIGLIAEKVTETQYLDRTQFLETGVKVNDLAFFDGVYTKDGKNIIFFKLDAFLESINHVIGM